MTVFHSEQMSNFIEYLINASKQVNNQNLSTKLERLLQEQSDSNQTLHHPNNNTETISSRITNQSGVCRQLAYYPRNPDGSVRDHPRIANYTHMEHSGGREMAYESSRLRSFRAWPSDKGFIKPSSLVKAGFYFDNIDQDYTDRVKCAFCRGVLHSWEVGDEPIKEHRRGFSTCPFLLSLDVGNVPMRGLGDVPEVYSPNSLVVSRKHTKVQTLCCGGVRTKRSHVKFLFYKNRFNSYSLFNHISRKMAKELASNGFYYTGRENVLECFKCHFQSVIDDNEAIENHIHSLPPCPYITQLNNRSTSPPTVELFNPILSPMTPKLTDSDILTRMDSWAVRQALELKIDFELVKFVTLKYTDFNGENFLVLRKLIDDILLLQSTMRLNNIDTDNPKQSLADWEEFLLRKEENKRKGIKERTDKLIQTVKKKPELLKNYWDDATLKEKLEACTNDREYEEIVNEYLKSSQFCKVCMDNVIDVVFIPCHHILACVNCTNSMRFCPACRSPIESTLRVSNDIT